MEENRKETDKIESFKRSSMSEIVKNGDKKVFSSFNQTATFASRHRWSHYSNMFVGTWLYFKVKASFSTLWMHYCKILFCVLNIN